MLAYMLVGFLYVGLIGLLLWILVYIVAIVVALVYIVKEYKNIDKGESEVECGQRKSQSGRN